MLTGEATKIVAVTQLPSAKLETLYARLVTQDATHPALSLRLSIEILPWRNGPDLSRSSFVINMFKARTP